MAITGRSKNRKRAGKRHVTTLAAATTIASLYMLAPTVAHAQKWSIDAGIGSQLTWSNNAELGIAGGREDTILNVRPHVSMLVEGAKLRVSGTAALNGIVSANGTQPNRVLPEADIGARLEAIDRFLFLDAGARALQTSQDAFGARPEAGTNANTVTTGQLRFSPSIESSIDSDTRYQLRSDNSWTRESGGGATATPSLAEGYFARHTALVEHDPRPLGWRLEAERQQTRYRDETQPTLTIDLFRVRADYAINTDFTAGVRVGRERTTLLLDDDAWHTLYGVEARWQPSSTTSLSAFREKRFYGPSWRLAFDHHTPLGREPDVADRPDADLVAVRAARGFLPRHIGGNRVLQFRLEAAE